MAAVHNRARRYLLQLEVVLLVAGAIVVPAKHRSDVHKVVDTDVLC